MPSLDDAVKAAAQQAQSGRMDLAIPALQAVLKQVRNTIRKAVPGTEEAISYQISVYKLNGVSVLFFAG